MLNKTEASQPNKSQLLLNLVRLWITAENLWRNQVSVSIWKIQRPRNQMTVDLQSFKLKQIKKNWFWNLYIVQFCFSLQKRLRQYPLQAVSRYCWNKLSLMWPVGARYIILYHTFINISGHTNIISCSPDPVHLYINRSKQTILSLISCIQYVQHWFLLCSRSIFHILIYKSETSIKNITIRTSLAYNKKYF